MAIELIQKIWCDGHLAAGKEGVEGETLSILHSNGKVYEIDLCNECQDTVPYRAMIDVAEVFGREETKTRKSKATVGKEATVECLFCDKKSPSEQGSKMHMRRSHPVEYAQHLGEDVIELPKEKVFKCEDCPREFGTQSALNGHRNSHRVKQSA